MRASGPLSSQHLEVVAAARAAFSQLPQPAEPPRGLRGEEEGGGGAGRGGNSLPEGQDGGGRCGGDVREKGSFCIFCIFRKYF